VAAATRAHPRGGRPRVAHDPPPNRPRRTRGSSVGAPSAAGGSVPGPAFDGVLTTSAPWERRPPAPRGARVGRLTSGGAAGRRRRGGATRPLLTSAGPARATRAALVRRGRHWSTGTVLYSGAADKTVVGCGGGIGLRSRPLRRQVVGGGAPPHSQLNAAGCISFFFLFFHPWARPARLPTVLPNRLPLPAFCPLAAAAAPPPLPPRRPQRPAVSWPAMPRRRRRGRQFWRRHACVRLCLDAAGGGARRRHGVACKRRLRLRRRRATGSGGPATDRSGAAARGVMPHGQWATGGPTTVRSPRREGWSSSAGHPCRRGLVLRRPRPALPVSFFSAPPASLVQASAAALGIDAYRYASRVGAQCKTAGDRRWPHGAATVRRAPRRATGRHPTSIG